MASEEPGPGQQYALPEREYIATLRKARPGIIIGIRWCPAHKGVAGNEKADEWGRDCCGGAGHPRGGMVELLRSGRGARDAPPKVSRQPQAGDLGEEVGRGASVGWRPGPQDEVPNAGEPEAGRHGDWEQQEACLEALPDQDGALPIRAVPLLDEEPGHPAVLVEPVPDPEPGPPIQGVPRVEAAAEYPVHGGGKETGSWKSRWSIRDPWRTRGAAGRSWTFSLLQTWKGEYQPRRT